MSRVLGNPRDPLTLAGSKPLRERDADGWHPLLGQPLNAAVRSLGLGLPSLMCDAAPEREWCWVQNPSGSFTKIAVIRPWAIALLMMRTLFTPLGTP